MSDEYRAAIVKWAKAQRIYNHSLYMPAEVMTEADLMSPVKGGDEAHEALNELYRLADLGPCDCEVCQRLSKLEGGDDE